MTQAERIYILGQSASGKTTFASRLSQALSYPHIQLDTYWHKHNGNKQAFKNEVLKTLKEGAWVVEGKHQTVRRQIMGMADLVIYLNFPLNHSIRYNIKRAIGNKEPVFKFSKHLLKVIREFYKVKRDLDRELVEYQHKLKVLKSFQETEDYLQEVA